MKRVFTFICGIAFSLPICNSACAHKPSDSYLRISAVQTHLTMEWDIALKDLEFLVGLDNNQDGQITWGEVKSQRAAIEAHALSRLKLRVDTKPVHLKVVDLLVTEHSDGSYAVLQVETNTPREVETLQIEYNLLFEADPTHRGLVLVENAKGASTYVLSPEAPTVEIRTNDSSLWQSFDQYVEEGVWHIWIGFDHILFLLCLLLPAVLIRHEEQWQPVPKFGPACQSVLKIVTMFTLAHSITLWLAVMDYVTLPSQAVEATIALSIVITAMNNLIPKLSLSGWVIAFAFGLVHGFGFANVLLDLGLSNSALGVSLLGFNVGVELGQLAIVFVFLPIAYLLRRTSLYRLAILQVGSIAITIVAAIWMYERIFNAEILGF